MAHRNKVLRSINAPGDHLCVDLFHRPDGSFGFEEYRRDPEDGRGWYPIGHHGAGVYDSAADAATAAKEAVAWLREQLGAEDLV